MKNRAPGARTIMSTHGASAPLLLVALAVVVAAGLFLVLRSGTDGSNARPTDDEPTGLVATVTECRTSGDTLWTEGTLRNAASIPIRNIEVSLAWTDAAGEEVATDILELVGAEGLMVGETTTFRGFTLAEGATDCSAGVFFYEPIT